MTRRPRSRPPLAVIALSVLIAACSHDPLSELREDAPAVAEAIERSRETNPDAWKRKVILLAFDACDPDLVDHYIRAGKLPNFARLRREGTHGVLGSLEPVLSPVVWTTVSTGMAPERHGILDFVTQTPRGVVPVSSRLRQADTMWELMGSAGENVGVVAWLVSWPADPVNGYLVSDREGLLAFEGDRFEQGSSRELSSHPPELIDGLAQDRVTIDDLPLDRMRAFVDVTETEWADAYTTTFKDPRNLLGALRLIMSDAETFRRAGTRLRREEETRFFAAYSNAMDSLSHYFMRYAPPKMPEISTEDYLKYKDVLEANYRWHDRLLGEYLALGDEYTTVVVVSDHGFKHGEYRLPQPSHFLAKTGAQWHRFYGVFYAWGYGVKPQHRVTGATVFDIAPTVLASMGYPVPDDMPGKVLEDVFEGGLPHETVPTWFGERRRKALAADSARDTNEEGLGVTAIEREEMARLAALGYIQGDHSDPASTTLNLANRLLSLGRVPRAIEELEKLLTTSEGAGRPRVLMSLASAHLMLAGGLKERAQDDDLEKSAEHHEKAKILIAELEQIVQDPLDVLPLHGKLAQYEGRLEDAERLARELVTHRGWAYNVHNVLALVLRARMNAAKEAGDLEAALRYRIQAIEATRAALRLEPRQWYALNQIAELLLGLPGDNETLKENADEALEHLSVAIELLPGSPKAWNNRSIAEMRIGIWLRRKRDDEAAEASLESAFASSERALEERPDYALGWANQAYILWQLGRLPEARDAALEARRIKPDYSFNVRFETALGVAGTPLPPAE